VSRAAIISGAAGAIGSALCKAFTDAGYFVVATDRVECKGIRHVVADLSHVATDPQSRSTAISQLQHAVSGHELGVLINNGATQVVKPVEELTPEDWQETLNVNVVAPFMLTQAFLPALEAAKGCVINISSIHARLTKPHFAAYATSKAALSGLTRSLAVELGRRVRINAISPGAIRTPMLVAGFEGNSRGLADLGDVHPVGRIGTPEEVAALAVFLASPAASYINGTELGLDGGIAGRLHDPA
jgi:NAD(P)-dependent dehydrogenase (short-subunit alcohol dehydrogenase family)